MSNRAVGSRKAIESTPRVLDFEGDGHTQVQFTSMQRAVAV